MRTRALATRTVRCSSGIGAGAAYPRVVPVPSSFAWSPTWSVLEVAPGVYSTTIDPRDLRLSTANTRYVDVATGSDANTGLVSSSPKKSIWSAINVGGNDTIYVKGSADPNNPTLYSYDFGWRVVPVKATNVIVVSDFTTLAPGYAISSSGHVAGDTLLGAWSLTADINGPNVYEATLAAAPTAVVDATSPAASGALTKLTSRASVALVEANPGSYYHDAAGGKIYVRTSDSRAPTSTLRPLKQAINGWLNTAISIYVERLTFEGGNSRAFYIQNSATATFVDCTFRNAAQQGLELNANSGVTGKTHTIYAIRCKFLGNSGDGIGSTTLGSTETSQFVEVDCTYAGNSGGGTDQGASIHFTSGNTSVSAIRINGRWSANKTQGFADTGGALTWCVGGYFSGEAIGAYVGGTGTGWLHGCTFSGCTTDVDPFDAGSVIKVHRTIYKTTAGSGTVSVYSP